MTVPKPAPGRVFRTARIAREEVRANRNAVYVFGDNMVGKGFGGQAAAMRGEINAIGVPTKWRPERDPGAYFVDDDWSDGDVRHAIFGAFDRIEAELTAGRDVVIPSDGLGTGLADLPRRAPRIADYIGKRIADLEKMARPL